jgi:uncharacterized protein
VTGWAYDNRTTHVRFVPFERRFTQRVFQLFLDIDRIAETATGLRLLSYNRPGLFAFYDRDHGDRSGAPLRSWAQAALARAGVELEGGPIRLLSFPRVLGYVFNPISVYFGYGPDGALRGVVYEVNNTFGETHSYAAAIAPGADHAAKKRLYVSPFFEVEGRYVFRLRAPDARFALAIENVVAGRRVHLATLAGTRVSLTDSALLAAFARLPLMTLQVTAGIHWQALQLWLRGARYRRRPAPPRAEVSCAEPEPAALTGGSKA